MIWRCNRKYGKPGTKEADDPGMDDNGVAIASSDESNGDATSVTNVLKCHTPHVTQEALEAAFMKVLQRLLAERDDVLDACRSAIGMVMNTEKLDMNATQLQDQMVGLNERIKVLIEQNARVCRDQADYQREYEELASECEKLNARLQAIDAERRGKADRARQIELFLNTIDGQGIRIDVQTNSLTAQSDGALAEKTTARGSTIEAHIESALTQFDPSLVVALVEKITIHSDGRMVFMLRNGTEMTT